MSSGFASHTVRSKWIVASFGAAICRGYTDANVLDVRLGPLFDKTTSKIIRSSVQKRRLSISSNFAIELGPPAIFLDKAAKLGENAALRILVQELHVRGVSASKSR